MSPERPILICYDGSEDAKHAIEEAGSLLRPGPALVLSVWQDVNAMPAIAWAPRPLPAVHEIFEVAQEGTRRMADEGAQLAREAGFDAEPLVAEAGGSLSQGILAVAEEHDVAAIVMGSRGLGGVRSVLLGSVSSGVVQRAGRPVLIAHRDARGE